MQTDKIYIAGHPRLAQQPMGELDLPLTGQGTATCAAIGLHYLLQNDQITILEKSACK